MSNFYIAENDLNDLTSYTHAQSSVIIFYDLIIIVIVQ